MSIRKSIFRTNIEKINYEKLCRQWSNNYKIYYNLLFLDIFDFENIKDFSDSNNPKEIELSENEKNRLIKTNVDYTLCNMNDEPILCIEFDDIQQGFNVGTKYIIMNNENYKGNVWQKELTELKLKVAHGSLFPYFVLGSEHFKDISNEYKLTIVDGIIGEVLKNKALNEKLNLGFHPEDIGFSDKEFSKLSKLEQHGLFEQWAIGVEVKADFENNPITKKASELMSTLKIVSYSEEPLIYNPILNGVSVVLTTPDFGEIKSTVWLPDFKTSNYYGFSMMTELAKLIGLLKLKNLRETAT